MRSPPEMWCMRDGEVACWLRPERLPVGLTGALSGSARPAERPGQQTPQQTGANRMTMRDRKVTLTRALQRLLGRPRRKIQAVLTRVTTPNVLKTWVPLAHVAVIA